ncbi:MAG TPA: hypothetical protein VFA49_07480 [Chloroflexota bacterium]|nr:hypothetical protein [Chloroflexota bacterium]
MSEQRPAPRGRVRRPSPARRAARPGRPTRSPRGGPESLRERLRRDHFLFTLCLVALGFMTWAFALAWWVMGSIQLLALAVASVAPAFYLFYLRDA